MIKKLAFVSLLFLVVACKKEEPPAPTEVAVVPPAEPAPAPAPPPEPAVDLETVAVEEDFEDEAEKELTVANLPKKLDELEKEIGAE